MSLPPRPSGEARQALLTLHSRIETFWDRVVRILGDAVGCRPGCDACRGQVLSLRPVEAAYLWEGARELPRAAREVVRRNLGAGSSGCPLLHAGVCLSYGHRPVVCRTHGLLLLRREGGAGRPPPLPRELPGPCRRGRPRDPGPRGGAPGPARGCGGRAVPQGDGMAGGADSPRSDAAPGPRALNPGGRGW